MFKNPYRRKIKKAPAQAEVETGSLLVQAFLLAGVDMPNPRDKWAIARTGELAYRRWRNLFKIGG